MNTWQSAWYHHVQQKQYCSGTGPYAVRAKVQNLIADKNQNLEHEWKHIPRYWPFVREIHRLQVDFPQKDHWRRRIFYFYFDLHHQAVKQIIDRPVIWDAIALIVA